MVGGVRISIGDGTNNIHIRTVCKNTGIIVQYKNIVLCIYGSYASSMYFGRVVSLDSSKEHSLDLWGAVKK